jgi:hypothetical protein
MEGSGVELRHSPLHADVVQQDHAQYGGEPLIQGIYSHTPFHACVFVWAVTVDVEVEVRFGFGPIASIALPRLCVEPKDVSEPCCSKGDIHSKMERCVACGARIFYYSGFNLMMVFCTAARATKTPRRYFVLVLGHHSGAPAAGT